MLWTDKYKPQTCAEIIGNSLAITQIKSWLLNYENKSDYNLLITGSHGTGKTTIIQLILEDMGFNIRFLKFSEIKNNKQIDDYINVLLEGKNICKLMNGIKYKKYAIIIDDIGSITSTIEKNSLSDLSKKNFKYKQLPIIFISNNQHNKLLNKLRKNSVEVQFKILSNSESEKIFDLITTNEHMNIKNNIIKTKIINHAQGDSRRLITILQNLYNMIGNKEVTEQILEDFLIISQRKNIEIELFPATEMLFNKFMNINDILIMYETEKTNLPLMIHNHYFTEVLTNFKKQDKLKIIKQISESLSVGDYVEYNIYNNQEWDMQEIHGYYTCVAASYYLNSVPKTYKSIELKFAQDLSQTSIRNINRKNISNIKPKFDNASIEDYIYMNQIVKHLIKKNKIKECANILKNYDITASNINTLIKIDKIKHTKNLELSSKNKKEFNKYLNI